MTPAAGVGALAVAALVALAAPAHPPVPFAPLTGTPDPGGAAARRPALAVKIENTPQARPQTGLDEADVVYEEVVEGGITRFWAVFSSRLPTVVGPIRSVRALDPDVVAPLAPTAVFSGGTDPNVAALRAAVPRSLDPTDAGAAFYRDTSRAAPHNLYARVALLHRPGPAPPPLFHYGELRPGATVTAVTVGFAAPYDVTWTYDPAGRRFVRSYAGVPARAADGQVLGARNVVVQFVDYTAAGSARLVGDAPDQTAWILTDGRLAVGRWSKATVSAPTRFTDPAGPIPLGPGPTWVELVPVGAPMHVDTTGRGATAGGAAGAGR